MKLKYKIALFVNAVGLVLSVLFLYYIFIYVPSALVSSDEIYIKEIESTSNIDDLKDLSKTLVESLNFSDDCIEFLSATYVYFLLVIIIIFILNLVLFKLLTNDNDKR